MTEQDQDRGQLIASVERKHAEAGDQIKQLKEQHESTGRHRDREVHERLWRQRHKELWETLIGVTTGVAALGAAYSGGTPPSSASPTPSYQIQPTLVVDDPQGWANSLHNPFGDQKQLAASALSTNVTLRLDKSGGLSIQYEDSDRELIHKVYVVNVVDALVKAGKELLPGMSAEVSFRVGNDLLEATVTLHVGFLTRRRKYRVTSMKYTKDKYESTDIYTRPDNVRLLDR